MKSGLCAMAFALHLLAERGVKPRETVRFLGTCDEEKGGAGAAAILEGNLFGDPVSAHRGTDGLPVGHCPEGLYLAGADSKGKDVSRCLSVDGH